MGPSTHLPDDAAGSGGLHPQPAQPRRAADMLKALHVRNFSLLWSGQIVSGTGTWMQTVAMAWLVLQISHSPAVLGLVTMIQFIPMLFFVLPAGVLADRYSKRKILLTAQILSTLQAVVLGVLTALGRPAVWQLAALAFTLGLANAFNNPAQQAFISELVGGALVPDAVALNSIQFNGTRMIGSALGGLAIAHLSTPAVFFINAASYAASLIALLMMRPGELHRQKRSPRSQGALREGLTFALHAPEVLFVLGTLAVIGTLGFNWPVAAPLIASDLLGLGAVGFGTLMAAFGAGAVVAGLGLIIVGGGRDRRIVTSAALLSVALVALGLSRSYPLSLTLMLIAGASGTVFTTTANSRLQALAPDRLRGRVMSLFVLLMAGSTPVGSSLLGLGAEDFGVGATLIAFGVASGCGLAAMALVNVARTRRSEGSADPARSGTLHL